MPESQLYLLYGPDDFSAREELRRLRAALDIDGNLAHNTVRFDARREAVKVDEVIGACQTASFFAEQRLVVADGLLERVGGVGRRGARGRTRSATTKSPATDSERLIEALTSLPATTTVVLIETAPPKALVEALKEDAVVREFLPIKGSELVKWATRRAESLGGKLTPAAAARLCELLDGYHLGEMSHEIEKLAAYARARLIEASDVDALVSIALQYQTWDLTDAVIVGRADRALQVLQRMDEKSFPAQMLFAILARQYRQLLLAKAMQDERVPEAEIGRRLGINHPFPLRKLMDQSARYPGDRLDSAYRALLETDFAVKTGVLDINTALEILIVELSTMVTPARSGSGRF